MGNVNVDSQSNEDDWPADKYVKAILLAREQTLKFGEDVKRFLTINACFMRDNTYHLGDSTIGYRTDVPLYLENKGLVNIGIDFAARTKSQLEESMAMITSQKGFEVFKQVPYRPDPLLFGSLDS